jgi:cystathionine gamma-lyase
MDVSTRVVRAVLGPADQGRPLVQGPVFAAPYHAAGDPKDVPFTYGRFHNPAWTAYERALGELEGADAVLFSSGMAACTAILATVLRPGDIVVLPSDGYYTVRRLAEGFFQSHGIEIRSAPTRDDAQIGSLAGARLLWLETPSNPGLDVCDIARLAGAAHEAGALVAVDNTTATPLDQQPLALGADFSLASDTKALTGHADLLLGHVAARDAAWLDRLRAWRTQTGAIAGPMETWMALRSLATLDVRLARQCENALAIASFLATHTRVEDVRYPGLHAHPAHALAARQMRRFGCVVSFTLPSRAHAERFLSASRLITEATSFGSVHTSAERRARWGGDVVPEGFIRLSAGCEAAADLLEDLEQALRAGT